LRQRQSEWQSQKFKAKKNSEVSTALKAATAAATAAFKQCALYASQLVQCRESERLFVFAKKGQTKQHHASPLVLPLPQIKCVISRSNFRSDSTSFFRLPSLFTRAGNLFQYTFQGSLATIGRLVNVRARL
jgi:hypothetical protein